MSEPSDVWQQLPREGGKAFEAFRLYLDCGSGRTVVAAAVRCSKSVSLLARWCRKFDWEGRARAFDAHFAVIRRRAEEKAAAVEGVDWAQRARNHREDEWNVRAELLQACRKTLEKFRDGTRGATLGDVARALDLASKLGRLASGLDLEKQPEESGEDVNVLVEIEAVLDKLYGPKAPPGPVLEVEALTNAERGTGNAEQGGSRKAEAVAGGPERAPVLPAEDRAFVLRAALEGGGPP
jgi:hypothetical protein